MALSKLDDKTLGLLRSPLCISSFECAIRELLSNSIDSGADNVHIVLDLRTFSCMISDNGEGLNADELSNVAKLNYTSKIADIGDLNHLDTHGFRGEALHSLSNVSSMTIYSKTTDSKTHMVHINYGERGVMAEMDNISQISTDLFGESLSKANTKGTTIIAANLFSNIPVRRYQMSQLAQHKLINDIRKAVFQVAVHHPEILVKVTKLEDKERKLVLMLGKQNELYSRHIECFRSIFGISILDNHEKLFGDFNDHTFSGIIGKLSSQTREHQHIFINKQPLIDPELFREINRLFHESNFGNETVLVPSFNPRVDSSPKKGQSPTKLLSKSIIRYPVFIISITSPRSISDLIQDPSKAIYHSESLDIIKPIIRRLFKRFLSISDKRTRSPSPSPSPVKRKNKDSKHETPFLTQNHGIKKLQLKLQPSRVEMISKGSNLSVFLNDFREVILDSQDIKKCSIISQVQNKFIMVKANLAQHSELKSLTTLMMIDQHACDERIKFEEYLQDFVLHSNTSSIRLTWKLRFSINSYETDLFGRFEAYFNSLGIHYTVNLYPANDWLHITHLPEILCSREGDARSIKESFKQYLYYLESNHPVSTGFMASPAKNLDLIPRVIVDIIASKACRSAIRFGTHLTRSEMAQLVSKLGECASPFQCAHGRPSIVPIANLGIEPSGAMS